MGIMHFTPSQKELLELSRRPIAGTEIHLVKIEEARSGVTTLARFARRESRVVSTVPLSLLLCATSQWDCMKAFIQTAGKGCWGSGYLDTIHRCLSRFSGDAHRRSGICLWLDRAGAMKPTEQETIGALLEWESDHLGIPLRVIYLLQKTLIWSAPEQRWLRDWIISAHLRKGATEWNYRADEFEQVHEAEQEEQKRKIA
jgi:hypothetical protein